MVRSRSCFLDFLEFCADAAHLTSFPLSVDDYRVIGNDYHIGEWIFSGPPLTGQTWEDNSYVELLADRGFSNTILEVAREFRRCVPAYLEKCVSELLEEDPIAIGFTTSFCQTIPSLAVASRVKAENPDITIVFGGANCERPMGNALFEAFECIDVVVQGEAELTGPRVFSDIARGEPVTAQRGVLARKFKGSPGSFSDDAVTAEVFATAPLPNYSEYFSRLARGTQIDFLRESIHLPIETARGCWWGEKSHCTFCGLNGATMFFRSKPPERVEQEFVSLAKRHHVRRFAAVDNILDPKYLTTLFPRLRDSDIDWYLFFEVKSNLTKPQLQMMYDAGVRELQPGIESLSTPILKLMRKGANSIQNIRFLKWCMELGIRATWNLIYGFPGEDPREYQRMAELIPLLTHLQPPSSTSILSLERFSPYYQEPRKHGVRILGPADFYKYAYSHTARLDDIAYAFRFEYADGREPAEYVSNLCGVVSRWHSDFFVGGGAHSLSYLRGPGYIEIIDQRPSLKKREIVLEGYEAAVYEICDRGEGIRTICARLREAAWLGFSPQEEEIRRSLEEMVSNQIMYKEGDRYLSLAVAQQVSNRPG